MKQLIGLRPTKMQRRKTSNNNSKIYKKYVIPSYRKFINKVVVKELLKMEDMKKIKKIYDDE